MSLDKYSQSLNNVPIIVYQRIHAVNMFFNDSIIIYITEIRYVANTPKKIYLSVTLLNLSTSAYYDDNNDSFEILFQEYTANYVKNSYHSAIIEEYKANMYKSDYKNNLHKGVFKTSIKR